MKSAFIALAFILVFTGLSGQETFTDKRDGTVYHYISFSGVSWMTENLKFMTKSGASCFDDDTKNIPGYGLLYDWKTAMSACPVGWHLPSGAEFRILSDFFEQKESWGKIPADPKSFNIQLGGMEDVDSVYSEMDESGYYWTSTEYGKNNSEYFSYLIINEMPVIDISRKADIGDINGTEKTNKYSVRCVKN